MGWRLPAYESGISSAYAATAVLHRSEYRKLGPGFPIEYLSGRSKSAELFALAVCLPAKGSLWYGWFPEQFRSARILAGYAVEGQGADDGTIR